ncbi:MAG TPA: RND transporter, partial [Acinetobacter radioresistens]|nr:RND transporter [Acinetobacter radioresistens]
ISSNVQLLLAQEQLAQLIGPYQESLAVLQENFSYQQPYPANLQEWTTLAQNQNLSVQQARLQQKYNDDQRRIERAALYPQLEAVATYGYTKQSPETLISGDGQFDQ